MQAGGWLIQNVQRSPRLAAGKFARELGALRFTARERGGRLPQLHVAEPDVDECLQLLLDRGNIFENFQRFLDGQVEQIGNRAAFVTNCERFRVVALSAADFTRYIDVRQEIHLDAPLAVALARLAAAALHVETESPGLISALARFRQHGVQLANRRENTRVRRRIRTRRAPDRRLINLYDLVDVLGAGKRAMCGRFLH